MKREWGAWCFGWAWVLGLVGIGFIAFITALSTKARAELPVYVDTYDLRGHIVSSRWYCPSDPKKPVCGKRRSPAHLKGELG